MKINNNQIALISLGINSLVITPWASCDILAHSKIGGDYEKDN